MSVDPVLPENPTQAELRAWLREMERDDRYFVRADVPGAEWTEVDRAGFAAAEACAGFYSAYGYDLATGGFSGSGTRGVVMSPASWDGPFVEEGLAKFAPGKAEESTSDRVTRLFAELRLAEAEGGR